MGQPVVQYRFGYRAIMALMEEFDLLWVTNRVWEVEWSYNLTKVIDSLSTWCKDSGIQSHSFGFTQIELCVTLSKRDAMMFKLRWHDAIQTP
jgi:hypothetical protein